MSETLEPDLVVSIIETQFPELQPVSVRWLGDGYDSNAFEINERWVFRFPKRTDVEEQLLTEARILPALALQSTIPVPVFRFHGSPSSGFPFRFAGYPMLQGVPAIQIDPATIRFDQLATDMGRFLSSLHAFPPAEAARLGVPRCDTRALLEEIATEALEDFEVLNTVVPDAPLDEWHRFLKRGIEPIESAGVLVHSDLAAEHILMDPATLALTGVIDWSDITIGDRALDFGGMFHWGGGPFVRDVLSAYKGPVDDGVVARARFFAACRGVGDVVFGLERGRREYVDSGVRALTLAIGSRQPR
jgi:aminoglycoside phosphotransferase (APT) family kinase protein